MQPYQEASEEYNRQTVRPFKAAATAIPAIAGLAGKGLVVSKIGSLLNKYVPESLAIKGLNKVDPRLGKFFNLGMEMGHSFNDLSEFIKQKIEPSAGQTQDQSPQPAKQGGNIVEQYSPELNQYMMQQIKSGKNPFEAGSHAKMDDGFLDAIRRMQKDHKVDWFDIIQNVYGDGQTAQPQQQTAQPDPMQQSQPQQMQQTPQNPGQGQQALMAILQKINQRLGQ